MTAEGKVGAPTCFALEIQHINCVRFRTLIYAAQRRCIPKVISQVARTSIRNGFMFKNIFLESSYKSCRDFTPIGHRATATKLPKKSHIFKSLSGWQPFSAGLFSERSLFGLLLAAAAKAVSIFQRRSLMARSTSS
jgi:hypothetical protein